MGVPSSFAQLSMSFTMFVLNIIIVKAGGTDGIAVFTSAWRVTMFGICAITWNCHVNKLKGIFLCHKIWVLHRAWNCGSGDVSCSSTLLSFYLFKGSGSYFRRVGQSIAKCPGGYHI